MSRVIDRQPRVALVCMPWASPHRPSIALGILARLCEEEGVPSRSSYANLALAARIGLPIARAFADEVTLYGMSEHLFATDVFSAGALDSDGFLDVFARILATDASAAHLVSPFTDGVWLRHLRDEVIPSYLDDLTADVLSDDPDVVGVTATFNQLMPSLALARRIKAQRPDVTVIAGGSCFDGEPGPELHRRFPHLLDHVFLGEAEDGFRAFLRSRRAQAPLPDSIAGVTRLVDGDVRVRPAAPLADLDTSPRPDYRPYFESRQRWEEALGTVIPVDVVPFESARGCWWGEKQQCAFCGINPEVMAFRGKTPARVVDDVLAIAAEHGVTKFLATDWILSKQHSDELFTRFAAAPVDLDLFYEVRADLRKSQLQLMRRAGVTSVQPGIESFSTPMLALMKKWTTGLRQIQFLRWCREVDIRPLYNLLHGLPGEEEAWYAQMARWIPLVRHLEPPLHNLHAIEMHRFAPLFEDRERYQVASVQLRGDYRRLFPAGSVDPSRVGYFHEYTTTAPLVASRALETLRGAIEAWLASRTQTPRPSFTLTIGPGFVALRDARGEAIVESVRRGVERDVLLLADEVQSRRALVTQLASRWAHAAVEGTIDALIDQGVMLEDDGQVLTLPVCGRPRTTEELRALVLGAGRGEPSPTADATGIFPLTLASPSR